MSPGRSFPCRGSANADWGKAAHKLKAEQVDFDIRLWPLTSRAISSAAPGAAQARWSPSKMGRQEQMNGAAKARVKNGMARSGAQETDEIADASASRDPDGRLSYRGPKEPSWRRRHGIEGGKAGAQPRAELQLKGKARGTSARPPLRRRSA